jgi:thiol-disulfide isomerase/thioredoxin
MNTVTRFFLMLMVGGFFYSCSSNTEPTHNIRVTVTDSEGQALPIYGLQLIDVNNDWLGTPCKSTLGEENLPASLYLPGEEPVIMRIVAPGYHPKFTFLMPDFSNIEFIVSLKTPSMPDEPSPVAVGNFNNFDFRSGIHMEQRADGVWNATVETELDTIRYFVRFNSLVAGPGTNGKIVINDAPGISEAFLSEIVMKENESTVEIEFDASEYNFDDDESGFKIISDIPSDITGIAQVYTLMTDEFMNQLFASVSHHLRGDEGRYEHDYDAYLTELKQLEKSFNHPSVSIAADLARFRFHRQIGLSKDDAISLLDKIEADSPLWMIHFTALTDAVNLAGLNDYSNLLQSIVAESSFESLRGEALYNLIRYHHQEENEEEWHSAFFNLVSNYPDYYRTNYAYQNYAPEQPIVEGKTLPYNEFNLLEGEGSINLHHIEESYLLVDFWATWCGPCIAAMPKLHELNEKYKGSDFAIISISVNEDPEHVRSLRNEWEMPWYHGHQTQSSQEIREMGIVGVPHYILLGPDRTVLSNNQSKLRGEELSNIIDNYLATDLREEQ